MLCYYLKRLFLQRISTGESGFLSLLQKYIYPRAIVARQVYISDRDKGIVAAVASCFPEAIPAYCY
jgi:hypothetical protein